MKQLTDREILKLVDRSLKQVAEDVRRGRIPLDGRVRFPPQAATETKNPNADA